MKIFLTGASGLLGSAFARSAARRGHRVIGVIGQSDATIDGLAETLRLELRDKAATERAVLDLFPDAIVNCAAVSRAADCERDPEGTRAVNVLLPEQLALLARHLFATLVHVSTEQVFDGSNDLNRVGDAPSPINEYGRQKAESEARVREMAAEFATILRLPLLNGNSPSGRRSLHESLFEAWARGEAPALFDDEIRQPCLADNAADAMVELCERSDLKGLFHWAGADVLSRWEMGEAIVARFGLPETLIRRARRGDDPRFAGRQARLAFDLSPLAGKLKTRSQAFVDQLDSLVAPKPFRAWYNAL